MKFNFKIIALLFTMVTFIQAEGIALDSLGFNVGYTKMNYHQKNELGTITLGREPDGQMAHLELYGLIGGVFDNPTIKPTINLLHAWNNDLSNTLLLAGVNKYYLFDSFNLYAGLLGGAGQMKWEYNPINYSKNNDYGASSLIGAVQAGVEYPLNKKVLLTLNAKYMIHNYTAELQPVGGAHAELQHYGSCWVSAGVRIRFHTDSQPAQPQKVIEEKQEPAAAPVAVAKDSDGDGVNDTDDACANTPANVQVDAKGCPLDGDKDGVADYLDKCAMSAIGEIVDSNGCAKDSDGDGVRDRNDSCANTPENVQVDEKGCPLDSDNDGIADYLDKCVNSAANEIVDENGCAKDSDGDGIKDTSDICQNTPLGFKVDKNGCEIGFNLFIEFASNSANIEAEYNSQLQTFADFLVQFPKYGVEINAYTDSRGAKDYNQMLSEKRAKAVYDKLISLGVAADRMKYKGYGEENPIASNATREGRKQNRRIEAVLIK